MADWTLEDMAELATRHADLEGRGELEPLLATLADDPVYEFPPQRLRMQGDAVVRRFYIHFVEHFLGFSHDSTLLSEWVTEDAVAQEYDMGLDIDGVIERHRVLGVLYRRGRLLGGERVYASERFIRLMTGPVFEELEPLD